MELIAAMALFGVVLTIAVPVVTGVAAVRNEAHRSQVAQIELGNIMEQLAARRRAGESVAAIAPTLALAPEAAAGLPDARLSVTVTAQNDVPRSTLVIARLTWTTDSGRPAAPAELCVFFTTRAAEAAP
jgi:type II secretory pathway pseudopilin PulG